MTKTRTALIFLGAAVAALPALALSENRIETYIVTEGKHPSAYQQALVVPHDSDGDVYVCQGYGNDGKNANEGYFRGTITVSRMDQDTGEVTVEKIRKRGNLDRNKWLRCVMTGPVHMGDTIVYEYDMSGFPRIRNDAAIHIRSSVGQDRMLISELRGPEATGSLGVPTEYHNRVRTNFSNKGKHPKTWQQAFVVSTTNVAETIELCLGYGNDFKKGDRGSFNAVAQITRTDADTGEVTTEKVKVSADVKDNKAKKCRDIDRLHVGDTLVIDYDFNGMPQVRSGETLQVKTGWGPRVMGDREIFGPAPPPKNDPAPPNPNPNPGPNPGPEPTPNPGGDISAADQIAASALLYRSVKTQLWRFKGNQPDRWTVIGPKTQLGNGLGGVNPNTTGYGPTIAAAVADYERKMGKLPAGSGLSASDVAALEWYSKMNAAGGPTSIRRDGGGGYHGEYYRPGRGSVVQGGFGGITAVVNWFKAQGL